MNNYLRSGSISIVLLVVFLLFTGGCNRKRPTSVEVDDPIAYDESRAMTYMLSKPRYALMLIDSAFISGNINEYNRQYLRAIVYYNGLQRADSGMLLCRLMTESAQWSEVNDTAFMVDVYSLMATIAGTLDRPADVIHYSQHAVNLAQGNPEMKSIVSDLLSRVGRTRAQLGDQEEGLEMMMRAFRDVSGSTSWDNYLPYVNIGLKIATTQVEMGQCQAALQTSYEILTSLSHFQTHSHEYTNLSHSMMQSQDAVDDFVEFCRMRCYVHIFDSFVKVHMLDSANYWLNIIESKTNEEDYYIAQMMIPSLVKMQRDDKVLEYMDFVNERIGADTIGIGYVNLLESMAMLYRNKGDYATSCNYLLRANVLRDSVELREFHSQLSDQLTLYELHEERFNRTKAEARSRQLTILSAVLGLSLLLLSLITFYFYLMRRFRQLKQEHVVTEIQLEETKQKVERLQSGYVPETPEQLYKRILNIMEKDRPYTRQTFDVAELAGLVCSNRTYISKVINKQTGMNFRSWLAQYRVNLVQQYMKDNPDASVEELCEISGYASRSTLFRQFKSVTGETPLNWLVGIEDQPEVTTSDKTDSDEDE